METLLSAHRKRKSAAFLLLGLGIWAFGCTFGTSTAPPESTPTADPWSGATPPPGMILRGSVNGPDGEGVAGVNIYLALASEEGTAVAETDSQGVFVSPHQPIPGDELVRVWGEKEGYLVQPVGFSADRFSYSWLHTAGFEERELTFAAWPLGMLTPSPTATSFVGHPENESMLHDGTFRITVILVSHLSNAMLLTLEVENVTEGSAEWSPDEDLAESYVLDGERRLEIRDATGIFSRDSAMESGTMEMGGLVFPLAREETFRFYYPDCEPAFVTLRPP
jgi:hypothetical protein